MHALVHPRLPAGAPPGKNMGCWFASASICASTVVAIVVALGATVDAAD
jgi:hypothetical protein